MKRREEMTFLQKLYVFEIAKGLTVTTGHLIKNFILLLLNFIGLSKKKPIATIQYPDETREYPNRYRGRHRLTTHKDGAIKCTACYLCATACPANCIYIEAAEHDNPDVEKFPERYEIDTLLCVYCGFCVEACPVDAIRMDTGIHPEIYPPDPRAFIEDKETLMKRSRIIDDNGKESLLNDHLIHIKNIEKKPLSTKKY